MLLRSVCSMLVLLAPACRAPSPSLEATPVAGPEPEPMAEPEPLAEAIPEPMTPAPNAPPAATASPNEVPRLPVHGLASLDDVRALFDRSYDPEDSDTCASGEVVLSDEGEWGLLGCMGDVSWHLPVIRSESGWSVFPPALGAWDSRTEVNIYYVGSDDYAGGVEFETWSTDRGTLLVYHIEATTQEIWPKWEILEPHRRTVLCTSSDPIQCTIPILDRVERKKVVHEKETYDRKHTYSATLRVKGDVLVVRGPAVAKRKQLQEDMAIFLPAGSHPLAELFARNEWEGFDW